MIEPEGEMRRRGVGLGQGAARGAEEEGGPAEPFTRHRELIPRRTLMTANNLKYEFV